jgi:hypothetical protein
MSSHVSFPMQTRSTAALGKGRDGDAIAPTTWAVAVCQVAQT